MRSVKAVGRRRISRRPLFSSPDRQVIGANQAKCQLRATFAETSHQLIGLLIQRVTKERAAQKTSASISLRLLCAGLVKRTREMETRILLTSSSSGNYEGKTGSIFRSIFRSSRAPARRKPGLSDKFDNQLIRASN